MSDRCSGNLLFSFLKRPPQNMTYLQSDRTSSTKNALDQAKSGVIARRESISKETGLPTGFPPSVAAPTNTAMLSAIQEKLFNDSTDADKASRKRYPKINLLGVDFDNVSKQELLSTLDRGVIFTPNVDHIMKLRRDPSFALVYQQADYKICDSQILIYAAKFLGKPLKAKLSGSDLFHWFCDYHQYNPEVKIFLLGGAEGVAKEAQRRVNARIGRDIIVGEYSPAYGFEKNPLECEKILHLLKQSPANVVAVCLGAPKQEKWIAAHRDRLPNIDIFMAVGATVDFEAGVKPRAPKFASDIGLEWLYRLFCEPRRLWRRYLLDGLPFLGLLLAEKLRLRRPNIR